MHIFKLSRYFSFYNFTFVLVFTENFVSIILQSTEPIYKIQIAIGVVFLSYQNTLFLELSEIYFHFAFFTIVNNDESFTTTL